MIAQSDISATRADTLLATDPSRMQSIYEQSCTIRSTVPEYEKKMHALNEYEKKFYPKFERDAKPEQSPEQIQHVPKASVDNTGQIHTGSAIVLANVRVTCLCQAMNEDKWLQVEIPRGDYIYFSITTRGHPSPLRLGSCVLFICKSNHIDLHCLVIQKIQAQDDCRDNIKVFTSYSNRRPTSFSYDDVFAVDIPDPSSLETCVCVALDEAGQGPSTT